jgi:hypothetical protein
MLTVHQVISPINSQKQIKYNNFMPSGLNFEFCLLVQTLYESEKFKNRTI